jgi:two-component system, OmpR family, response regulator
MDKPFALIIEDDPKLGAIFTKALDQAGYETALDADGNRFMMLLDGKTPTVILMDLHLPYASGDEVLARIRANDRLTNTPVIVATADIYLAKTFQSRVEYVLQKPVSMLRLIEIATRIKDGK